MVIMMMEVELHIDVLRILRMIVNQVHYIFNVGMVDGVHDQDVFVCILFSLSLKVLFFLSIVYLANGCLEPMPDTIENGWKSAESYLIHNDIKYYTLTRYSCHANAVLVDSSSRFINIECRNNQWEYQSLPVCQLEQ